MLDQKKGFLTRKIDELAIAMEKMKLAEYVDYLHDTKKMLITNFMAGIARGLGMAIGFTVLGALVVIFLQQLVMLNLPLIGDFIADLVRIVNDSLGPSL